MVWVSSAGFHLEPMSEILFSSLHTSFSYEGTIKDHANFSKSRNPGREKLVKACIMDERKLRRMLSNRESARRSRIRKRKHMENLRNQVNRLRTENQLLVDRLRTLVYGCNRLLAANDLLVSEHVMLQQKLADMREAIFLQQRLLLDLLHDHPTPS
ncbi:hypothetical protein SAY86_030820 [Trapa natans]|uniref:BZIP domain-containing protein n=1 Tax=Trapa natans TaxID=22666 RepID=A0AAN7M5S1_TRANT|nr:hypothetical protein SAY86_030820 [Trapa natans]